MKSALRTIFLTSLYCSLWNLHGFNYVKNFGKLRTWKMCEGKTEELRQRLSMGQQLLFYNAWPTLLFLKIPWKLMQWHNWVPAAKASFLGKCPAVDQQLRKPGSKAWSSLGWTLCTQNRKGQILIAPQTKPTLLSALFCISSQFLQDFSLTECEFQSVYSTWTKQK